jgi:mannose-6-phosphate isomerase
MSALQIAAGRARAWLTGAALPLWGSAGVDQDGAFHERLDFAGRPDAASFRRMRVQARQLHVFCEAQARGWSAQAGAIADRAFERFIVECWAPDGRPGFIHKLTPDRRPLDARRDMYDHAFGLFALAWRHKACGDPRARALAGQVLEFVDAALADRVHGGYLESIPPALPRRADPHMHFLEACLEWHSATGEAVFLDHAQAMVDLFAARFVDPATGALGEYFAADLSPAEGAAGQATMAGHHFEWVWLLDQAAAAGVRTPPGSGERLYAFGLKGLDAAGFAIDETDRQGHAVRTTRRAWPQTEMIKAYVTRAKAGSPDAAAAADKAAAATEAFLDSYLATAVPGLWQDQFDAGGLGLTAEVPASTLYHIVIAFRELMLLAERRGA